MAYINAPSCDSLKQGFQLLGIAWREKHRARRARTHEWDPVPPKGSLVWLTGVQGSGHLYFGVDITLVKGLSKHTLSTYYPSMTIHPNYVFLDVCVVWFGFVVCLFVCFLFCFVLFLFLFLFFLNF